MRMKNRGQRKKLKDWVCCVCNNLNFSFRTCCNRCRLQTKAKNDQEQGEGKASHGDSMETALPSSRSEEEPFLLRRTGLPKDRFPQKVLLAFSESDWEGPPFEEAPAPSVAPLLLLVRAAESPFK
jgi:hypothetical protein